MTNYNERLDEIQKRYKQREKTNSIELGRGFFYENTNIRDFRRSLPSKVKRQWMKSKRLTYKKGNRDWMGAVAVCSRKRRYTNMFWLLVDATRLHNNVYRCLVCGHLHMSRQSTKENRRRHANI